MCVYSNVLDHYQELLPLKIWDSADLVEFTKTPEPLVMLTQEQYDKFLILLEYAEEIQEIVKNFKEAAEAAKTVDRLTGQADCMDPSKASLLERVAFLEEQLKQKSDLEKRIELLEKVIGIK